MSQNDTSFYPNFSLEGCQLVLANENQHNNNPSFTLFPNPSSDYAILEWNDHLKVTQVSLYNNQGLEIQTAVPSQQTQRFELNMTSYPDGLYRLVVSTADKIFSQPLIKINSSSGK